MKANKPLIAIIALLSLSLSAIATASQTYKFKGEAPVGSHIKTTISASSKLPFNKAYYELSDSERQVYRAQFGAIGNNVIPPFPRNGLKKLYRPLIDANEFGESGVFQANITVNEHGQVDNIAVVESPSTKLSKASLAAIKDTKFNPGFCNGQPCSMVVPVRLNFE